MSTNPTVAQRLESLRFKFPGLIPEETLVAREWLKLHEGEYSGFQYNVRIGSGDDPGPAYPEYARKMAIGNSQLRLDAVAWQDLKPGFVLADDTDPEITLAENPIAVPTLIEFKRRAATSAVSQLLAYAHLWADDFGEDRPPRLRLVANRASDTILPILQRANITLDLVAVDFSPLFHVPRPRPPQAP